MRETVGGARLVIAGNGEPGYVRELQVLSAEQGIAEHVTWAGHVKGVEKAKLFAQATAFVLPSVNENFGIAPVEALAAGVPVVLTRGVAIHREVEASQAGIIVDDTVSDLADAMIDIRSAATQRAMSQQATALARDTFSVEAMQKSLIALYQKILAA